MNSNAIREKFGGDYIADGEKQQGKVLNFDRDHDKCEENRVRSSRAVAQTLFLCLCRVLIQRPIG